MKPDHAILLRDLLYGQPVAALGTLHRGDPFVSMVPFALLPDGRGLVIHVSRLATHTQDMLAHPRVSLMVMASSAAAAMPQALARATVQAEAAPLSDEVPLYGPARAAYLARFPDSEPMFGFGDFTLFALTPLSVRLVGGFAQATSLRAQDFTTALQGPQS